MNDHDITESQFPLAGNEIRLLAELGFFEIHRRELLCEVRGAL